MNNSTQLLAPLSCAMNTEAFKIVSMVLYMALFCISLLGNILVMIVVYRNKSLRNSANYFIVNMAVSDLFIPILVIPRVMKEISTDNYTWDITGLTGEILCKVVYFLSDVTPMVSILSLILISWDRFCAVIFPFHKRTYVPRWLLISSTWVISFGVLAPHLYTFKLKSINGDVYCFSSWSPAFDSVKAQKEYSTFIIVVFIVIPFFVLSFIYLGISFVLVNQKVIGDRSEKCRAVRDRKTRAVLKLAFTIVLASAVCYGPYSVMLLLQSFKFEYSPPVGCSWAMYVTVSLFLTYSNAAVNPMIYFIYVQNYKKELKRILHYMSRPFSGYSASGALVRPQQIELIEL